MHFMNPVPVMKLVEIIRGLATDDAVYETIEDITKKIGKVPVEVNDFQICIESYFITDD